MATWQELYPGLARAYAANPSDPQFSNIDYWNNHGVDLTAQSGGVADWMKANDTSRSTASAPTWQGNVNTWMNTGGSGTNAAPWQDPRRPNEMTQFNQLYSAYQNDVNNWNTAHPTSAVTATDRNSALAMPVSYNPDLIGKGGGFFGSGLGKAVLIGGGLALGAGALGAFGGAGAGLSVAGDAFLPGALGAEGLGAGAAATFGGATGLPAWAGGAADTALGGGIGGTGLGGASLAGEGLTTAGAVGTGFAGGAAGTLGAAGIDAAAAGGGMLSDLPAWAGGAGGTSLGGSTSILDQLKQLVSSNPTSPAGNAASRILNGTATNEDYLSLAGKAGSSILGYLGAENKANALTSVADKNLALGAPYRGMLAASYDPSFSMSNEPGYKDAIDQSMNSYLRKASTGGNPFSNPGVSTEALKYVTAGTALPAMNTYRSQLGTFGQLGLNTAGTAQMGAAGASGGTYDALGYGLGQLTQPDSTLQDLLKKYASGNSPSINYAGIS